MDLTLALDIANKAHAGQVDKLGQPYILHLLRVMLEMDTDEARVVAVLHDLVEDTCWLLEALADYGLPPDSVAALDALTRRKGEPYLPDYIERVAANPLARKVKLADLADNLSPLRRPTDANIVVRRDKYKAARKVLLAMEPTQ